MNDKYRTYVIVDDKNNIEVSVVPELGGMMTGIKVKGKEILYLEEELLKEKDIHAGGFPVLFPISGSLKEGRYKIGDDAYSMPSHGFARTSEWTVKDFSFNSITLVLSDNKETKKYYPFDFNVFLTYALIEGQIIIKQEVENNSTVPMPFCSGYHPFFKSSDKQSIDFDINAESFINYNSRKAEQYRGIVDFSEPVDHVFTKLTSKIHSYTSIKDEYSLKMVLDEKMDTLVLWTMENKDFICLEPWMAKPNAMNTGENLCWVEPGSKVDVQLKLEIQII